MKTSSTLESPKKSSPQMRVHDRAPRQHLLRMAEEEGQEIELARRELNVALAAADGAARQIDGEIGKAQDLSRAGAVRSATTARRRSASMRASSSSKSNGLTR